MCDFNKKIIVKNKYREKLFDEFLHFGYTRARIKDYILLRENEIERFGSLRLKTVNIFAELSQFFTALILMAGAKGIILDVSLSGEGEGTLSIEEFEYIICRIINKICFDAGVRHININVRITGKKISLRLFYTGRPIKGFKRVNTFNIKNRVLLSYCLPYERANSQRYKPAWEWMADRLSDINLALIDM